MTKVSAGQMRVLAFISEYIGKHGYAPTMREIMDGVEYKSTASAKYAVEGLIKAGLLETDHPGSPRALRLSTKYIVQKQKESGELIYEGFLAGIAAVEQECAECEYYDQNEDYCRAFECNGLECPELPCEK